MLASIFASYGGYEKRDLYVDGLRPAIWVGAVIVGIGALAAVAIPPIRRRRAGVGAAEPVADAG